MSAIQRKFGKVVRRHREAADFSQEALAEAAGIHRTYMGKIERCLVAPTITVVEQVAAALGMTGSELLAEAERER